VGFREEGVERPAHAEQDSAKTYVGNSIEPAKSEEGRKREKKREICELPTIGGVIACLKASGGGLVLFQGKWKE